jgi:ribosome-associated toxin RatA of RatAB toxin-antitoxin module
MRRAKRSALVPYSPAQMFRLVDAAEHYPDFLPWCSRSTVHYRDDTSVEATLEMRRAGLRKSFRTRNTQSYGEYIQIELAEGPFRLLQGNWTFTAIGDSGCRVELEMRFEFESAMLDRMLGHFFEDTLNSLVDAFTRRAAVVYGPPAS